MFGRFKGWFSALSSVGKVGVIVAASVLGLGVAGATGHPSNNVDSPPVVQSAKIEHKTIIATEPVAFDTKTVNDPNLASGTDKTTTEGVDGVKTKTYDQTLTNGIETSRTLVKEEVTTQPVIKVITRGTYVAPAPSCSNGTYVNSAGNTVCSPYSAPSTPAGATAQCRDGTYSFSQSRSGTCSHHGGVATWL